MSQIFRLNAGWSCHTGKKTIQKDSQLTENELNEIQKVLQRSQTVERNERDRVMYVLIFVRSKILTKFKIFKN